MNTEGLVSWGVSLVLVGGIVKYVRYCWKLEVEEAQAREKAKLEAQEKERKERERVKEEIKQAEKIWLDSTEGRMTKLILRYSKFAETVPTKHLFELFQEIWEVYLDHLPEQFETLPGAYKAEITETMTQAGQSRLVHELMHSKILRLKPTVDFKQWWTHRTDDQEKFTTHVLSNFHKAALAVVNTAT